jgi:preprotein translocase subunit SecA
MNDIYSTVTERFLKVQLMFEPALPDAIAQRARGGDGGGESPKPRKRYNALGILEDVPEETVASNNGDGNGNGTGSASGTEEIMDIAADEPPKKDVVARRDPIVVGAGRTRSMNPNPVPTTVDWSNVGRNDPCPCGSGKKFKKCHGATL